MSNKFNFLTFPIDSIKNSIRGIDDSYSNPWDILAELTQNSVDAIRRRQDEEKANGNEITKGCIHLGIDSQNKTIEITDNGCGMSEEELPEILRPFKTQKQADHKSVGEKGVGLKFVYFQSTYFEIDSFDGKSGCKCIIENARLWKISDDMELPYAKKDKGELNEKGTKIVLKGIELNSEEQIDDSIFNLTIDQMEYLLRTKTFLGDTSTIWDETEKIKIDLSFIDRNGETNNRGIKNEYMLPTEGFKSSSIIDIDDFTAWTKEDDRSDKQKRNKLNNKIIVKKGSYTHGSNRKIKYWACFVPSRSTWAKINEIHNLPFDTNEEESNPTISYCSFKPGIFMATKSMPTGISILTPSSGAAGYWQNIFMIFQDDALSFDIGRKSIHGNSQKIYQQKASEIFREYNLNASKYITPSNRVVIDSDFERDEVRDEIEKYVDLNSDKLIFKKYPYEQEASVVAIFFELIGNGTIKEIVPLSLGYKNRYDLYAYYWPQDSDKGRFKVFEIKSKLRNIISDFGDAKKVFDEIDYIVCWEIDDRDVTELNNEGIICEEINVSELAEEYNIPRAVTHLLSFGQKDIFVIDLKMIALGDWIDKE